MAEVYLSSGSFPTQSLDSVLSLAKKAGIDRLELSGGLAPTPDPEKLLLAHRPSLRYLIHNYFPVPDKPFVINLASAQLQMRRHSIDFCRAAIDLAHAVGSSAYSVHSGFCTDLRPDELNGAAVRGQRIAKSEARQNFFASLVELQQHAASKGVLLCVENNVIEACNVVDGKNELALMTSPQDFIDFIEQPQLHDVGILLDVGHLKVSASAERFDPEDAIEAIGDRAHLLHLSDNDGVEDNNSPFGQDAWFWPHLKRLKHVSLVTLEVCDMDLSLLRTFVDQTAKDLKRIWA